MRDTTRHKSSDSSTFPRMTYDGLCVMDDQPRVRQKPRVRAFSHKSRTGCLTCKKRRKKCGEEKPSCLRCLQSGFVCDGYSPAPTRTGPPPAEGVTASVQTKHPKLLPAEQVSFFPGPRQLITPGNSLETYYYVYFFTDAVSHLEISPSLDAAFWRRIFHSPSQGSSCIRHSIIALGATHRLFLSYEPETSPVQRLALIHYNQAISEIVGHTKSAQESETQAVTVLTCCLLFILIECLRGNFEEAIRHVRAGLNLILYYASSSASEKTSLSGLAALFHAIGSQLSLFSDDGLFPDLTAFVPPMKKYKRSVGKLRDLDEAEDIMNSFDDVLFRIAADTDDSDIGWENYRRLLRGLGQQVQAWDSEFQSLIKTLPETHLDSSQFRRVVNLRTQHKLWQILLESEQNRTSCDEEPDSNVSPRECNDLLGQIEWLWGDPASSTPHFGLKTDLITAVYQLYVHCKDETVRRRIILLLRSRRRREIAWDSIELARFLEKDLLRRRSGEQKDTWPDIGPSTSSDALLVLRPHTTCCHTQRHSDTTN